MSNTDFYCPKCGNTGIQIDGTPCTCKYAKHAYLDGVSCLDVPTQYIGLLFDERLVPKDCGDVYAPYLSHLHASLCAMKLNNYNACICSPIAHSKTVMCYSVLETLFRQSIPTFPVCSIMEAKHVLHNIDVCSSEQIDGITNPENILKAPYVFLRIPMVLAWDVYYTIIDVLTRRVRLGLSTFFIYDGYWDDLVKFDNRNLLESIKGNGCYNTIEVKNFYRITDMSDEAKFEKMLRERRETT